MKTKAKQSDTFPSTPQPRAMIMDISPYQQGKAKVAGQGAVIKLSSNESNLGPSPKVYDVLRKAERELHRYPEGSAQLLREAIAEVHKLPAGQIVCGNGSDELIGLLIQAYCDPGDEMIYSQYGFLMYRIYAKAFGVKAVAAPEKNLKTDVDAVLGCVTDKTKVVFIANPNNPTGSYISQREVARLRKKLPPHVLLVLDNAYSEYVEREDYTDGHELVAEGENTVVLHTFSKIYALPLIRVGWAYAPEPVADVLNRIRSPFNVNGLANVAGAVAMRDQDHIREARAWNSRCLKELPPQFEEIGIKVHPSVTNFLLLEFPDKKGKRAEDANKFLLSKGIILRDTVAYGLPNCLRMTIGLGVENSVAIDSLATFMKL
ncbi:histidinol-phosphate transaminase [bacterium]|nr:histidinol-phosphate transaminase [bacterium]